MTEAAEATTVAPVHAALGAQGARLLPRQTFRLRGDAFVCLFGDLNPNTRRRPSPAVWREPEVSPFAQRRRR